MPSETDCLNDALGMIGESRITAIDDGSVRANYCQTFYPTLRDGLLRSHHWNFAMRRVELAQDAIAPSFEFVFSYTLPTDLLKITEYNGAATDPTLTNGVIPWIASRYTIEGRQLLTNDTQVKIVYVARVTDPNLWDAMFYQVMSTWLASKLAAAIMKDDRKAKSLLQDALGLLPMATALDGQEGTPPRLISDSLTRVRS